MSSEKTVNVAIAGASGAVGEALIDILQERKFPVGELALLASSRSEGKRIQFNGKSVQIRRLDAFDFSIRKLVCSPRVGRFPQNLHPRQRRRAASS